MANANPFEVLALDPMATEEQVVEQAGRLRQRSTDEDTLTAVLSRQGLFTWKLTAVRIPGLMSR